MLGNHYVKMCVPYEVQESPHITHDKSTWTTMCIREFVSEYKSQHGQGRSKAPPNLLWATVWNVCTCVSACTRFVDDFPLSRVGTFSSLVEVLLWEGVCKWCNIDEMQRSRLGVTRTKCGCVLETFVYKETKMKLSSDQLAEHKNPHLSCCALMSVIRATCVIWLMTWLWIIPCVSERNWYLWSTRGAYEAADCTCHIVCEWCRTVTNTMYSSNILKLHSISKFLLNSRNAPSQVNDASATSQRSSTPRSWIRSNLRARDTLRTSNTSRGLHTAGSADHLSSSSSIRKFFGSFPNNETRL